MTNNKSAEHGQAAGGGTGPSVDRRTRQPIEEAEDNLSHHATKDSSPPVAEQGRTTEKVAEGKTRSGAELRDQDDGRKSE
ncbi:MAG TPA: hypothetical protein VF544_09110 [Pyrinomonadaceae bacterium]|jgi:hypothetical protein